MTKDRLEIIKEEIQTRLKYRSHPSYPMLNLVWLVEQVEKMREKIKGLEEELTIWENAALAEMKEELDSFDIWYD